MYSAGSGIGCDFPGLVFRSCFSNSLTTFDQSFGNQPISAEYLCQLRICCRWHRRVPIPAVACPLLCAASRSSEIEEIGQHQAVWVLSEAARAIDPDYVGLDLPQMINVQWTQLWPRLSVLARIDHNDAHPLWI